MLAKMYPDRKFPKWKIPNFIAPYLAHFDSEVTPYFMKLYTRPFTFSHKRIVNELNFQFTPIEQTIRDTAESIIALRLDKKQ